MAEAPRNCLPSGHDEEFVSEVEDDCQCLICHLPLKEPVLTRCGHRFCKECLEEHLRRQEAQARPFTCPADREALDRDRDIFPDKATGRKILSLAIKCPSEDCKWTGELRNKEVHLEICPSKIVSCTNKSCHVTLKRKDLEQHVTITCEWRIIECEYCREPQPECHMLNHIKKCNKFPLPCPNNCGGSTSREMIPLHIENDCPLTLVSCPYVQMGCKEEVQRKDMQSHLQSTMREHLDFTCAKFNSTQVQLDETQAQLSLTQNQLSNTQETTRKLEKKVEALQKQLESKTNRDRECNKTRFIWKINEFSIILREMQPNIKVKVESDPFYTDRYGYKLKVVVCPYDIQLFPLYRYLSVAIVVIEGEYDAMLPWPFNKKVTLTLIDQQEDTEKRENVVGYLNHKVGRPKGAECSATSEAFLISREKLQRRRYRVDDTLFLQVEIGPP